MFYRSLSDLIDSITLGEDAEILDAIASLESLRDETTGDERASVCWALREAKGLLTMSGRNRRLAARLALRATSRVE